jgi:hypothetical protein
LTAPRPGEDSKQEIIPPSRIPSLNQERHWRELRAVWARPWPDDEAVARRPFAEACRHADASEIIEGARTWVAAADAPRFLPALHKGLDRRGWEKVPPRKKANSGHGRKRKPSVVSCFLAGGYPDDDDGEAVYGSAS